MYAPRPHLVLAILLCILVAAFSLRIAKIETIPAGIYPDEAQNGVDAQVANATGSYRLFYEENNGREGLFINLQAASIRAVGNNVTALKLPSIIFGTLTVLGLFFLAAEILETQAAGLVAAFLMAFSYWAINFSRIGFRAIMLPFVLTWSFYFVFKGLRTRRVSDFILGGVVYGLGLHTYIAFRCSPLVLIVLLVALLLTRKGFLREYGKHLAAFALAMSVAAAPMILDFLVWNPGHLRSRGDLSVFNTAGGLRDTICTITRTSLLALQKYFYLGDLNIRHNYPPYPLLNPVVAVAFLVGLIHCLEGMIRGTWRGYRKGAWDEKLPLYAFLLSWLFALLLPEILANEGNPHALRSIGTMPVVMIVAVFPFLWGWNKSQELAKRPRYLLLSLLGLSLLLVAVTDTVKYFVLFANSPRQRAGFNANLAEVSRYLGTLPRECEKYLVTGKMERLPILYLNPAQNTCYLDPADVDRIRPPGKDAVIIFASVGNDVIARVRERFPLLRYQEHRNSYGDLFYTLQSRVR